MSDQKTPISLAQFADMHGQKCVCGLYHVGRPLLRLQHEYDQAPPERQQEMLAEVSAQSGTDSQ